MTEPLHDAHVACLNVYKRELVEFDVAWEKHEQLDQRKADIERWQRLEKNAPTPSEAIAAEQKLESLRAQVAGLMGQLAGATQEQPQAALTPALATTALAEPEQRSIEQPELTVAQVEPNPASARADQAESVQAAEADRLDLSKLATPDELIEAFGRFTGMGKSWFSNITDKPGLEDARRIKGLKGKGGHKPLFCPLAVMGWLTNEKRKVGHPISEEKCWALLESYFPRVYDAHASADPR